MITVVGVVQETPFGKFFRFGPRGTTVLPPEPLFADRESSVVELLAKSAHDRKIVGSLVLSFDASTGLVMTDTRESYFGWAGNDFEAGTRIELRLPQQGPLPFNMRLDLFLDSGKHGNEILGRSHFG